MPPDGASGAQREGREGASKEREAVARGPFARLRVAFVGFVPRAERAGEAGNACAR